MSGGKGGEQTTEIDPQFKDAILKTFNKGEKLSQTAPLMYTGITRAAPSEASKKAMTNVNGAANLLGIGVEGDILAGLPNSREVEMGGIKGYAPIDGTMENIAKAREMFPNQVSQLEQLVPGLFGDAPSNPSYQVPNGLPPHLASQLPPGYDYSQLANIYKARGKLA
jgi:hypothetical protein